MYNWIESRKGGNLKKSFLFNILAGLIIIGVQVFHIVAKGANPLFPVIIIGLFLISFIMERKGVSSFYWAGTTIFLLLFSLWTMLPQLFFGP
ncbi:signal transduction histidine kinase [Peribacillus simplex]|nr:signal transduction histidine kinase [Peribacillus simplex]